VLDVCFDFYIFGLDHQISFSDHRSDVISPLRKNRQNCRSWMWFDLQSCCR